MFALKKNKTLKWILKKGKKFWTVAKTKIILIKNKKRREVKEDSFSFPAEFYVLLNFLFEHIGYVKKEVTLLITCEE